MRKQRGFLEDSNGDKSNSRLVADIIVGWALLMAAAFLIIGVLAPTVNLMSIATAISVLFGSLAGSALFFLFGQKWTEAKQQKSINDNTEITPPTTTETTPEQ